MTYFGFDFYWNMFFILIIWHVIALFFSILHSARWVSCSSSSLQVQQSTTDWLGGICTLTKATETKARGGSKSLRGCMRQWLVSVSRLPVRTSLWPPSVSKPFPKTRNCPHCSVLVGSRSNFGLDLFSRLISSQSS